MKYDLNGKQTRFIAKLLHLPCVSRIWYQLNWLCWFSFRLRYYPNCIKQNITCFRSDQKWPNKNHLDFLIKVKFKLLIHAVYLNIQSTLHEMTSHKNQLQSKVRICTEKWRHTNPTFLIANHGTKNLPKIMSHHYKVKYKSLLLHI